MSDPYRDESRRLFERMTMGASAKNIRGLFGGGEAPPPSDFQISYPPAPPHGGGSGGGGGFSGPVLSPPTQPGLGYGAPTPFSFEDGSFGYPSVNLDPVLAILQEWLNRRFPNGM